ncbi:MAG: hypothetical protein ACXWWU_11360 [Candidatus Limnocylindria bacterium]
MTDWLRSLAVLAASFAGVVVLTVGLAVLIVPDPVGSSGEPGVADPSDAPATSAPIGNLDIAPTAIGGTLVVTGDRALNLVVDRESADGQYGLIGDDARVFIGGDPLSILQMNLDGLSFFPDPDECTITPGLLNQDIGVAGAHLRCEDLADIRGDGVVTVDGVVGIAADVLGMRGDLPRSGGTITFADETLEFADAVLYAFPSPVIAGEDQTNMGLVDGRTELYFSYDVQTHGIALVSIERDDVPTEVPPEACSIATRALGKLNPRVTVIEMALTCAAVQLPDLGTVTIDGALIVEQIELSF